MTAEQLKNFLTSRKVPGTDLFFPMEAAKHLHGECYLYVVFRFLPVLVWR